MKRSPKDVESYIALCPPAVQSKLVQLRKTIMSVAPESIEKISYGMPYYGYKGRLAYFAAFKKHIGLYIPPPVVEEFSRDLSKYVTAVATVRFPIDKPLPAALIKRMIKSRMKKNEEKRKK